MIVPMKKVSLVLKGDKIVETLTELRKLGILQIEIKEASGESLENAKAKLSMLESSLFALQEKKVKKVVMQDVSVDEATAIAKEIAAFAEEKKECQAEKIATKLEIERIKSWGDIDPQSMNDLAEKGIEVLLYEMPKSEYKDFGENVKVL